MSDEMSVVQIVERVADTQLAAYADRDLVRELAYRLMKFHPAAKEVGQDAMLAAAQLAIVMGASPLPGTNEIHIYRDNRGVTVQPGINYWRRRATQYGGIHWIIRPRPMTDDEVALYGLSKNELGAICRASRQFDVDDLMSKGLNIREARESSGATGLGTVTTDTASSGRYKEQKNGRPLIWTAIKRAETDVLKQLFPFVPGEQFAPGLGLARDASGALHLSDERQWQHAGDPVAIEAGRAPNSDTPQPSLAELNQRMFGGVRVSSSGEVEVVEDDVDDLDWGDPSGAVYADGSPLYSSDDVEWSAYAAYTDSTGTPPENRKALMAWVEETGWASVEEEE